MILGVGQDFGDRRQLISGIQSYGKVASLLNGVATDCMGVLNADYKWLSRDRERMAKAVCGVISSQFMPREGMDPTKHS